MSILWMKNHQSILYVLSISNALTLGILPGYQKKKSMILLNRLQIIKDMKKYIRIYPDSISLNFPLSHISFLTWDVLYHSKI